ncbi:MAG: hypothetical protein EXQ50_06185 [Acidobacteria bacterium]|nr:hypothetical protein [Acidobacteriota bacterium]MSO61660.1 hypothetical protein [Acidobacteriota bacterium]
MKFLNANLPTHDEPGPDCFVHPLHLQLAAERVVRDDIDKRSERGRDAHAGDRFHVPVAESSAMELEALAEPIA